jgi:hypothetical protein
MNAPVTLYAIAGVYLEALGTLEVLQDEGELSAQVVADTLEGIAGEFDAKAIAVGAYIRGLDAQVARLKAEENRLADWRKRVVARQEHLTDYLAAQMRRLGKTKIEGIPATLTVKKSPPKVVIDALEDLPEEFVHELIEFVPDKTAIGKALKTGAAVSGAHLEQSTRLEIK